MALGDASCYVRSPTALKNWDLTEEWVAGAQLDFRIVMDCGCYRVSLVAQMVKHLPAKWETRVQSLDREDLLEKEMAIHSSTLAWKITWTVEPGRLQSMGSQRVRHGCMTLFIPSQEPLNKEQRNIYSVN